MEGDKTRVRKLPRSQKRDTVFIPCPQVRKKEKLKEECTCVLLFRTGGQGHITYQPWAATMAQKWWLGVILQREV